MLEPRVRLASRFQIGIVRILFSDRPICMSKASITNLTMWTKEDRLVENQNRLSIHHLPDRTEPNFKASAPSRNRKVARIQEVPPIFTLK
jgi:hypothetical protein